MILIFNPIILHLVTCKLVVTKAHRVPVIISFHCLHQHVVTFLFSKDFHIIDKLQTLAPCSYHLALCPLLPPFPPPLLPITSRCYLCAAAQLATIGLTQSLRHNGTSQRWREKKGVWMGVECCDGQRRIERVFRLVAFIKKGFLFVLFSCGCNNLCVYVFW